MVSRYSPYFPCQGATLSAKRRCKSPITEQARVVATEARRAWSGALDPDADVSHHVRMISESIRMIGWNIQLVPAHESGTFSR
jgi:hypothetical protein